MLSRLCSTLLLLPLALLAACGSTAPISSANPIQTGDYVFTISPTGVTALNFSGNLNVVGSSFAGIFRYNNPAANCVSPLLDIPFSGAAVNGVVTLTSGSFSGGNATLTFPIPLTGTSSGSQIANGTAVISGGTCALASNPFQLTYVPPFQQTYTGALTGPVTGTLTLGVTQSAANADGQFPVTAAVSFSGTGCNFSLSGVTGLVSGYTMYLGNGQTIPNNEISITANASTTPVNLTMNILNSSPTCPIGQYSGTIH